MIFRKPAFGTGAPPVKPEDYARARALYRECEQLREYWGFSKAHISRAAGFTHTYYQRCVNDHGKNGKNAETAERFLETIKRLLERREALVLAGLLTMVPTRRDAEAVAAPAPVEEGT